jgi:predicted nucleic acid-binding protein
LSSYLLDTNVVSALAPNALDRNAALADWLGRHGPTLYLPSIVIAELSAGVARLRRVGATRKAEALNFWLVNLLGTFQRQVLPFDAEAALATGVLLDRAQASGLHPGFPDLAIGGVAVSRGMTVLTRNLRDFAPLGIAALDPFATLPE